MRRPWALAGIAAASLIPLAAGEQYLEKRSAFYRTVAIPVSTNSHNLAAAIRPRELADVALGMLRDFQSNPLRGHRDYNGKDRLKAWDWAFLARAATLLYGQTHDRRLIDGVLAGISSYAAEAELKGSTSTFGWYTDDAAAGRSYREVEVAGLIMAPIVDLLLEARRDPELAELIALDRGRLLGMLEQAADGLSDHYLEDQGRGYFLQASRRDVEPINLASVYAEPLLGLWQLTQKPEYLREATGVAQTWKALLDGSPPQGATWPYWPRPSPANVLAGPRERLVKGAIGLMFAKAAYEAGVVLDHADIEKLAQVPFSTSLVRLGNGYVLLRAHLDVASDDYLLLKGKGSDNPLALGGWYIFSCFDGQVADRLDPIMFGLDPKFFRHHKLALYGMAARLQAPPGSPGCRSEELARQTRPGAGAQALLVEGSASTNSGL